MRWSIAAAAAALVGLLVTAPPARAADEWSWPVRGRVVTPYVNDNARPYAGGMHRGIDIAAGVGTPVVASHAGTVTFAGALGSSGNVVAVRGDDGRYVASYLHLSVVSVERGAHVGMGARVGEVGTTGRRSVPEPHLHFGVRLADVEDHYVDPLSLLPPSGVSEPAAPAPVPLAVPVRAQEQAAPAAVRVRARAVQRIATPVHGRASLHPAPSGVTAAGPERMARPSANFPSSVRTGRTLARKFEPAPEPARIRHPAAGPVPATAPDTRTHHGNLFLWAGLALVMLVLFGGALARLNDRVNARAAQLFAAARTRVTTYRRWRTIGPS